VQDLPHGAVVGSSSVRRKVVLESIRPDLKIVDCRGNIQTRLAKLESENLDAIILACAGLKRAELFDNNFCFPFEIDEMIPGAGQGIITIQTRCGDKKMEQICAKINHLHTWHLAEAEREFLAYFDASCRTPIAAYAKYLDDDTISARYMYGDFEGSFLNFATETGGKLEGKEIAVRAARKCEGR
jgi:hydroxymethylbilane synthase